MISPIIIDFSNVRQERQRINNLLAIDSIIKNNLTKNINIKEYNRILTELEITQDALLNKCNNDNLFLILLASKIAINASRQGVKDEELQINTCNITSSKFNIIIEKLSVSEFRPTKSGEIVSNIKMNNKNDCLKSFDAKISGIITGWVFAKVVFGNGGHQDNVFEEAYTYCEWIIKYGNKNELFIVLIDTNLNAKFEELKQKYINISNIIIGNHIAIQQYFIDNYANK
jgi:hypothetical protein